MTRIEHIFGRQIIDSRGKPTVEVDLTLESGYTGRFSCPSGASTGSFEAHELRDEESEYGGYGVEKAVQGINGEIRSALTGNEYDQQKIDDALCSLDGTETKERLGANAILSVSLSFAKAVAQERGIPLYQYISQCMDRTPTLPKGMFNILNGGIHANNGISFQEFMIIPSVPGGWKDHLRCAVEIYHTLKEQLAKEGFSTSVGDEGGFAPTLKNNEEALKFLVLSIEKAGYTPGNDVMLGIDAAANEMKTQEQYLIDGEKYSTNELTQYYRDLIERFPILSIEDPYAEDDEDGFSELVDSVNSSNTLVVADDLFVTNPQRISKGIEDRLANAVIIKPNQIGTLSQTLQSVTLSLKNNILPMISHRSGDTDDTFISHLAVGTGAPYIKSGAPARGERVAKYNELLRIEENLQN